MVQNDSRIKDLRHSLHLFRKSPLAVIGLIIVLLFVLVAVLAPYIAPYGPQERDWYSMLKPPGGAHILGTDDTGGDLFSRIVWGSQISLRIGIMVVGSALILGAIIGAAERERQAAAGSVHRRQWSAS
jgi:peptide/nickel transport system permease protein